MNRLGSETSPYLRQHAANPVEWWPWGSAAFEEATRRDVPVLLSVGYSACHWCHVMAHESFEDNAVADEMNRRFVCVKVDREERPDVDAVYMDAVQAMTRRGGWPMTVFLTPTGEPFHGGTYYPKPTFLQLLAAVSQAWTDRRDDINTSAASLRGAIGRTAQLRPAAGLPEAAQVIRAIDALRAAADRERGGFGQAPKFPSTMNVELLLDHVVTAGSEAATEDPAPSPESGARIDDARSIVTTSLDAMAAGGIHDHLGGGFARYSTDEKWLVPHFEKMLYDQALLLRVYARASAALGVRRWARVADDLVEYVLRDLRHPDGGFLSAEDADSKAPDGRQQEGIFYTFTPDEVDEVLGPELGKLARQYYGISGGGNFEGRSIPNRIHDRESDRTDTERPQAITAARTKLREARQERARPGLDDKVLTEWNAMMVASMAEAGRLLGRPEWIDAAVDTASFLERELRAPDGRWMRSWQADGAPPARHAALAGDHAALVDAFVALAEATGQARWITLATATADTMLDWFWDPDHGGLFTTANDAEQLIVRQKDVLDGAMPSANSTAAVALYRLAALTGEGRYTNHADRILTLLAPVLDSSVGGFAQLVRAVELQRRGIVEVAVVGERPDLVAVVNETWRPGVVLAFGEPYPSPLWEGRTDGHAYVCEHFTCQEPQTTAEGLRAQL